MESVYEKIVVDLLDTRLSVVDSSFEYLLNKFIGKDRDHRHISLPSRWLMNECGSLWKEKVCEYFGVEKMVDTVNLYIFRKFHADTMSKVIDNDEVFEEQVQQTWIVPNHYVEWSNNKSYPVDVIPNYNVATHTSDDDRDISLEEKKDAEKVVKVWQDIVPWSKESIKGHGLETPPKKKKTKSRKKRRDASKNKDESVTERKKSEGASSDETKIDDQINNLQKLKHNATDQQHEKWKRTSGLMHKDKSEWYDMIGKKSSVSTRATTPSFSIGLRDGPSAYAHLESKSILDESKAKQKETMKKNKEKLIKRVKGPIDKRRLHNLAIATMCDFCASRSNEFSMTLRGYILFKRSEWNDQELGLLATGLKTQSNTSIKKCKETKEYQILKRTLQRDEEMTRMIPLKVFQLQSADRVTIDANNAWIAMYKIDQIWQLDSNHNKDNDGNGNINKKAVSSSNLNVLNSNEDFLKTPILSLVDDDDFKKVLSSIWKIAINLDKNSKFRISKKSKSTKKNEDDEESAPWIGEPWLDEGNNKDENINDKNNIQREALRRTEYVAINMLFWRILIGSQIRNL
jgi:hypothetical protein